MRPHIHAPMTEDKCPDCIEAERDALKAEVCLLRGVLSSFRSFTKGIEEVFK